MSNVIRPYKTKDHQSVRSLFIEINRLIAPPEMFKKFEAYISLSLKDEIDRIQDYYNEHNGCFWVADIDTSIVGMFGLESLSVDTMELRRMYVSPNFQRRGIARKMLKFAEEECSRRHKKELVLSTSELQEAALSLYKDSGYKFEREKVANQDSNKTVGSGIRRYYFSKQL